MNLRGCLAPAYASLFLVAIVAASAMSDVRARSRRLPVAPIITASLDSVYAEATGIRDAYRLAQIADSFDIPRMAFWGLMLQEGGPSGQNNMLGCDRFVTDSSDRRKCAQPWARRDIGRAQLNPRGGAVRMFCPDTRLIRTDGDANRVCAARYYVYLRAHKCDGSDECTLRRYNGGGPATWAHLKSVKFQVGHVWLQLYQHGRLDLSEEG